MKCNKTELIIDRVYSTRLGKKHLLVKHFNKKLI